MNKESVKHLLNDLKRNEPRMFAEIMREFSDGECSYKLTVDPKLITEAGDDYCLRIATIYRLISNAGFATTIKEGDIIETKPTEGSVVDYLELLDKLYSIYRELGKTPILYSSFETWTPVATRIKAEISITKEDK